MDDPFHGLPGLYDYFRLLGAYCQPVDFDGFEEPLEELEEEDVEAEDVEADVEAGDEDPE